MDQYWKLVNVDKRQTIPRVLAKMIEILGNRDAKAVIPLLRVPKLGNALASDLMIAKSRTYNISSRLVALPQEIIDAIIIEISDPGPILSLALTCSYFWRVLLPRIKELIISAQAPWAGDRLVFVGNCATGVLQNCSDYEVDDMPQEVEALHVSESTNIPEIRFYSRSFATRNPLYAIDTIERDPKSFDQVCRYYFESHLGDYPESQLFLRLITTLRPHTGSKRPGVLRNLTKQQYVMDSKLAMSNISYSLGDIIVS
ncbi:hypothetical protein F5Y04DRAFT_285867 [Hypomontagnella monticulosa]|nr:hypothetical protein F5Y04DRAFT_285867 [Hypomontagnella monticulosa]